jgi:hypothetical protein
MISIDFTRTRAQATQDTQANLINTLPNWVWSEKTLIEWGEDIGLLDQTIADESAKRTQWRNAAELWQADINRTQEMTRDVVRAGAYHFRNDPIKRLLFEGLSTDARSRADIYDQALAARDAWQEADPAWALSATDTLPAFSTLLAGCITKQTAHSVKFTAWRRSSAALMNKAREVDEDCIAWYAAATRRFPEGTTEGDMIRSTVPTTTRTEPEVEQAVISNVVVGPGTVHFDVAATGATRFTFLHQSPGSPAFVVVLADSPEGHLSLASQPAGLHRFKVFGSNSGGAGPESAVAEVTVSVAAAA